MDLDYIRCLEGIELDVITGAKWVTFENLPTDVGNFIKKIKIKQAYPPSGIYKITCVIRVICQTD
jgi:hypothetical protein